MPGPYDEALRALDGPGPGPGPADGGQSEPAPEPAPPNPYDAALKALDAPDPGPDTSGMRAAAIAAQKVSPEQAAQAAAAATRTGLAPSALLNSIKTVAAERPFDATHYDDIAARHPELAQWLTEPAHAAIARDDLPNLRDLSTKVQALTSADLQSDAPELPILGAIKQGVYRSANTLAMTLMAGPAWLQKEARELTGISSTPNPWTPLGMVYGSVDQNREMQRVRDTYAPSAMRDFVSNAAGMAADPTNILLPAGGAGLAIKETAVLGEAMAARTAIKAAAAVQGEVAGGQTAVRQATEPYESAQPRPEVGALAQTANTLVQGALAFFGGKLGQEIPLLRAMRMTPFEANPLRELAGDIGRQAVVGGTQSAASGEAEDVITQGRVATPGELTQLYVSGAIPGGLLASGNVFEALQANHHLQVIRHAEAMQFSNKMADSFAAVQASSAAKHSPEEVGKLIDSIAGNSGIGAVYLQSEEWQNHFLAKGQDPVAEADKAGLKDEYIRARSLGGDMRLPVRAAIGLGIESENPAALAAKMRPAANAPNAVEAATFFQEAPGEVEKQKALAQAQIEASRGAGDTEGATVFEERKAEMIAAGMSPQEADTAAKLHQRFFTRLAEKFNAEQGAIGGKTVSPTDLADQFRLTVRRAMPQLLEGLTKGGTIDAMLDSLRAIKPEQPDTPEQKMARQALTTLGLDPTTQTNDQIRAELAKHAGTAAEAGKEATPHVVQGRRVIVADVPYGGGTSADGKTVYIDRRIPRFMDVDGKRIDMHQMIAEHEIAEKERMDRGESYSKAHGEALKIEDDDVDHQGVKHEDYERALKPYLDQAKSEHDPAGIPTDIERKPYADMGEEHLLEKAAADPAALVAGTRGVTLEQGGRLFAPGGSLRRADMIRQWRAVFGERKLDTSSKEWRQLVQESAKVDAARGLSFNQPAFHGSPHIFDKFTTDHIGTGEGFQVFGHGLYFAGKKEVAKYYREMLSKPGEGRLYKVEIPEDNQYLHWDKPFIEQPANIQKALEPLRAEYGINDDTIGRDIYAAMSNKLGPQIPDDGKTRVPIVMGRITLGDPMASKLLESKGIAGIKYLDQFSRGEGEGSHNYVIFKGADAAIVSYEQDKRGQFTSGKMGRVITLFQGADRSTVFHELGHYFLDVMGKLAERADAPQALKEDFQKVMEWSGYGDRAGMVAKNDELLRLQAEIGGREPTDAERAKLKELSDPHETFARGFEAYLMTGQAPATGLRRAFARLKAWMKSVYQDIRSLGVQLNPEITGVFDRMLASDREIAAAKKRVSDEPAFKTQEESGYTPEKWAEYQRLHADAARMESEELERELMAVERKTTSDAYKEDRAAERERVAEEVGNTKVHAAIRQLQDGELPDGRKLTEPMKLAKKDVERLLTPEEQKLLPGPKREKNRGRSIVTTAEHGEDPDVLAPRLGYGTGHEMLQDLIRAPDREKLIDQITDERMKQRYPDPMDRQTLMDEEADKALHSPDLRGQIMDMERKQVAELAKGKSTAGKQAIKEVRDERQAMRVAAREMIRDTKLSDFDPARFVAAERRASIGFAEAMAKKDYEKALDLKRAQMMNAELSRAAHDAKEQAAKDQKHLVKVATDASYRQELGKAGGWEWTVTYKDGSTKVFSATDEKGISAQEQARHEAINKGGTYERTSGYLDQVDSLLERYDIKKRSPKDLRRRESLKQFLDRAEYFTTPGGEKMPNGFLANIPERLINEATKVNVKNMTLAELHDLRSAISSLEMMAKLKNKLLGNQRYRTVDDMVTDLVAQVKETSSGKKDYPIKGALFDVAKDRLADVHAASQLVHRFVEQLDGHEAAGPFHDAVTAPLGRAMTREIEIKEQFAKDMHEAFETLGYGKFFDPFTQNTRKEIPGIKQKLTQWNRIMALMWYGNPEGRQRLRDGEFKWGDKEVHAIVDGLSAKEIAFANKMAEIHSSRWAEVKEMEERLNGVAPKKVEAIPVELPNGTYKGGYIHLYYDRTTDGEFDHSTAEAMLDGMQGRSLRAMTAHGYTNERVDVLKNKRPNLDPTSWSRALNEVAHDLSHREVVLDLGRLYANKRFSDAMIQYAGERVFDQFVNQLKGVAAGGRSQEGTIAPILDFLRRGANTARVAYDVVYALKHFSQLPVIAAKIGPKYTASAVWQLLKSPLTLDHLSGRIKESSPFMRERDSATQNDISANMLGVNFRSTPKNAIAASYYYMIRKVWSYLDNVAWKGAYDRHIDAGHEHADAVTHADQVVASVMGSHKQKDVAQIAREGALSRVLLNYGGWAISNANQIGLAMDRVHFGWRNMEDGGAAHIAKGLGSLATIAVLGPMLWDWLNDELHGRNMKDWRDPKKLAWKAATAPVYSLMSGTPIARDMTRAILEGQPGTRIQGMADISVIADMFAALHAKHYKEATAKAVAMGLGTMLHLPSAALIRIMDGAKYADQHHEDAVHAAWHMVAGKPPKAHH